MNPELKRNLLLELSSRRLIAALAAVGLLCVAAVLWVEMRPQNLSTHPTTPLDALGVVGMLLFLAAGLIWGARQAGAAVMTEVGERTWDFQRMSALTPWRMTWGKLFGATSLAWLVALIGTTLAAAQSLLSQGAGPTLQWLGLALSLAVLLQATALASSLVAVRKARAEGRLATLRNRRSAVIGLVVAVFVGNGLARGLGRGAFGAAAHAITWWGLETPLLSFAVLTTCLFAAWALVAAWRLMRVELQGENSGWPWAGFVLFAGLYLAGFVQAPANPFSAFGPTGDVVAHRVLVAGAAFGLLAYVAAFSDPADRQRLMRFRSALAARDLRTASLTTPLLLAPLVLAAAAATVMLVLPARADGAFGEGRAALAPLAGLAFVVRDVGAVAWIRYSPRPKRSDAWAVVALVLLYAVGSIVARALLGRDGPALVTPLGPSPGISLVSGAVQAAAIWWFAVKRIFGRAHAAGPSAA